MTDFNLTRRMLLASGFAGLLGACSAYSEALEVGGSQTSDLVEVFKP